MTKKIGYSTETFLGGVLATVEAFDMFHPRDRVLVGVSGGPDSMALLNILGRLAARLQISLGVAHLHHGLRGADADADERFVAAAADRLNLPCHRRKADVRGHMRKNGLSLEEAGRELRYRFFSDIALEKKDTL